MSGNNQEPQENLRRRAEKQLRGTKQELSAPPTFAELQRLVHELAVHQIELELQNEELQDSRAALETYLRKYTDLYDFSPVGYVTLDPTGLILHINLPGARMLGTERFRLIGQPFAHYVSVEHRSAVASLLHEVFRDQSRRVLVVELPKSGDERCVVHVEAIISENESECRLALLDITAQKLVEESLQASENRYRSLFESMSQGVLYQCRDGSIITANPAAERIFGLSIGQMEGKTWTDLFTGIFREDGSEFPEDLHPNMVAVRTGRRVQGVVMGLASEGANSRIWLKVNATPRFERVEGNPIQTLTIFDDITTQRRMVIYNRLTPREKEVFNLLVQDVSRSAASEILGVSPKTVDKHKENLMEKLNIYTNDGIRQFAQLIGLH